MKKEWICQLCLRPTMDLPHNAEPLIKRGKCCKSCSLLVLNERLKSF